MYSWVLERVRTFQCSITDPDLNVYCCQFIQFRIFGKMSPDKDDEVYSKQPIVPIRNGWPFKMIT